MAQFDSFWLLNIVSFVTGTLVFAMDVAGLVLSLRWWRAAGLSARLAAAGFGLSVVTLVGSVAAPLLMGPSAFTFLTPYAGQELSLWPLIALSAASSLGSIGSTALLVAALWTAWRRHA